MAAKKQTLANALLDAVLRNVQYASAQTVYCGLCTVPPTAMTPGTEVTGGGYGRVVVIFSPAAGGATSNSGAITFSVATAPWGNILAAVLYDAEQGGNQLYFGNLGTPKAVGIGDQLTFAAGALSVTES